MDTREEAVSRKRQQKEETNTPASKRFKSTEAVVADVKAITNECPSNKTTQQPTKIYYTRLRRRMEEEEKLAKLNPQPIIFTTKLTDVNFDCLEHIFKRLSLTDLLNVAESNKQLKPAADLAFKSQFGNRLIKINLSYKSVQWFEQNKSTPAIPWSFCFKLLRCFGHLITKLKSIYDESRKYDATLAAEFDRYVNEYCAESLVEIQFRNCKARIMEDLKKPFTNVESVCLAGVRFHNKTSELNAWFPKMRRLNLFAQSDDTIAVQFPHLQDLSLCLSSVNHDEERFAELLHSNPNLRALSTNSNIETKYLQCASELLQHLESLEIRRPISYSGNRPVHFPSVKKLTLQNVAPEKFPLTFDQLEELVITPIGTKHSYADLIISNQASLRKLIYRGSKFGVAGALLKIASPSLVEVDMNGCRFPIDEVVTFVNKCTALKKLSLGFDDEKDYKEVQNRLSKEWRGTGKMLGGMYEVTMER
ncbi:uncharacterized protein LOC129570643 [Sitodiplosis mosellana]|uniref:uncharacterized protein LOC129570643 n=1 Tax=Sitodiplosis mosellana TaxID=263140 RepID=UPI0024439412|nr:uncharacterized protein LOC129570643 [Sitodiplosis mosellana]